MFLTVWHEFISQAPVRIIAIASVICVLLQAVKRFYPGLGGYWAIAVNLTLSTAGVLALTDPSQFWTINTAAHIFEAGLAAAGIHGTAKALSDRPLDAKPTSGDPTPIFYPPSVANPAATFVGRIPAGISGADPQMKNPSVNPKSVLIFLVAALAFVGLCGCNTWERTTFQTLSASKATIDQAQADYESGKIKQTAASFKAINDLKASQTAAVQAMVTYESIKAAKGSAIALDAQQQIVAAALAQIGPLIAAVKGLYTTVTTSELTPLDPLPYIGDSEGASWSQPQYLPAMVSI